MSSHTISHQSIQCDTFIDDKYLKLTVNIYEPYDSNIFPVFAKKHNEKNCVPENLFLLGSKRHNDVFTQSAGKRNKLDL